MCLLLHGADIAAQGHKHMDNTIKTFTTDATNCFITPFIRILPALYSCVHVYDIVKIDRKSSRVVFVRNIWSHWSQMANKNYIRHRVIEVEQRIAKVLQRSHPVSKRDRVCVVRSSKYNVNKLWMNVSIILVLAIDHWREHALSSVRRANEAGCETKIEINYSSKNGQHPIV